MGSNEGGSMPTAASIGEFIRSWRLKESVCLVSVWGLGKLALSASSAYEQYVPPNNADGVNGYPVLLESEWCLAEDFSSCNSTSSDTACCQEIAEGVQPGETVSSQMLRIVSIAVPLAFIVLRQISIGYGLWTGAGTFADLFFGLLFSLTTNSMVTGFIKTHVGRPRPIYFALQALIEYGGSDVYSLEQVSITSFPSGHSSESMSGLFFVTLVCWADLLYSAGSYTDRKRVILAYLAVLPTLVSVWVGVTRISDYWHFQDDVLAGWTIGALAAATAVGWVIFPQKFWRRSAMVDDPLEEDLKIKLLPGIQNNGFALMDSAYGSASYNVCN